MLFSVAEASADIRWEQRFQNFRRAYSLLREAIGDTELAELDQLQQEGVIQRFEYTFELAWKTLKDYLEFNGVNLPVATPRSVVKACAATGLFLDAGISGETYLTMLDDRNALSHTYDFARFRIILAVVKSQYLPELTRQYEYLFGKLVEYNG